MFTGQMNRISAARRALFLLALVWALALLGGCGGQDEPAPTPARDTQAMVPVEPDSTVPDSTGTAAVVGEDLAGTSAAGGVHPAVSGNETVTAPRQEPVSNPFNRAHVTAETGDYSLQLGSFRSAANARAQVERIGTLGHQPEVEVATLGGQTYHRVVLRGLADRAEAERLGENIHSRLGITYLIRQR